MTSYDHSVETIKPGGFCLCFQLIYPDETASWQRVHRRLIDTSADCYSVKMQMNRLQRRSAFIYSTSLLRTFLE